MPAWYPLARTLHVLGAILLVGNVIVSGVWAALLWRDRAGRDFTPVARAIWRTDLAFTLGGGALLVTAGTAMVVASGRPVLATPWLVRGIAALALSMLVWLVVLIPAQRTMLAPSDEQALRRAYRRWPWWGWGATVPLVYAVWAMVTRTS